MTTYRANKIKLRKTTVFDHFLHATPQKVFSEEKNNNTMLGNSNHSHTNFVGGLHDRNQKNKYAEFKGNRKKWRETTVQFFHHFAYATQLSSKISPQIVLSFRRPR